METVKELMRDIIGAGIDIREENGKVKVKSPKGNLDRELLLRIKENKESLIYYLNFHSTLEGINELKLIVAEPDAGENRYPLSFAQKRLWFLEKLTSSSRYNMPAVIHTDSEFEVPVGKRIFELLIRRHESLRTVYSVDKDEGEPFQSILADYIFDLPVSDLSSLAKNTQQSKYNELVSQLFNFKFDLSSDLLIKCAYIKLDQHKGVLLCNTHHIAADGWSTNLLEREFLSLYHDYTTGTPIDIEPSPFTYKDYAVSQRFWKESSLYQSQLSFWCENLKGIPTTHSLPLDFERTSTPCIEGSNVLVKLTSGVKLELLRLASERGVTLFTLLHAAFSFFLARHSDTQDIVLGTVVANRRQVELEPIIGFFANTIVLRTLCDTSKCFAEYLEVVKSVNLEALRNQDVPFEYVVETLNPDRSSTINPLFQVLFTLNNNEYVTGSEKESFISSGFITNTSKFDLTLHALEMDDGIQFVFEYATSLFRKETIENIAQRFVQLLENIEDILNTRMVHVDLNLIDEKKTISELKTTSNKTNNRLAHHFLEERAALSPEIVAVESQEMNLTYFELNARANKLAGIFLDSGVIPGGGVGVCIERSLDLVVSVFAILKCGAAFVPLDVSYPAKRKNSIIKQSGMSHIVINSKYQDAITYAEKNGVETLMIDSIATAVIEDAMCSNLDLGGEFSLSSNAFVMYTSGSTSRPKGVAQTHLMLSNLIISQAAQFGISEPKRTIQFAPITFDPSIHEMLTCCYTGSTLVLITEREKAELENLPQLLIERDIQRLFTPPAVLNFIMEQSSPDQLEDLVLSEILAGGEQLTLSSSLVKYLDRKENCRLFNVYGPTETHVVTVGQVLEYRAGKACDIGIPLLNVDCRVLDSQLGQTPYGTVGELYVSGPCLASGYHLDEDLTKERFIIDPLSNTRMYKTGDLVKYNSLGKIEFVGRRDEQVKLRGFRIELKEIEYTLNAHPSVASSVVIHISSGINSSIEAYITTRKESLVGENFEVEIMEYVGTYLPYYMVPSIVCTVERIPFNHNGKVDKKKLRSLLPKEHSGIDPNLRPRSKTELLVAGVWAELLNVDLHEIGMNSNFFKLGGHSLLGARLISRVRKVFRKDISLKQLFDHANLTDLSNVIEASALVKDKDPIARNDYETEWFPLSFAQKRLWFMYRLEPDSAQFNLSLTFKVDDGFCIDVANGLCRKIIDKHAMLRVVFRDVGDGEVQQKIRAVSDFLLEHIVLGIDSSDSSINEAVKSANSLPFNLTSDLLIRVQYFESSHGGGVLNFCFHHIVVDAWSLNVIADEFSKHYQKNLSSVALDSIELEEADVSYRDYVTSQEKLLKGKEDGSGLKYWENYLRNIPVVHKIPLDYPRRKKLAARGGEFLCEVDKRLFESIARVADEHKVTLFMLLQTAFSVLISRWSGSNDVVIGSPIHGRKESQLEEVVGLFLNNKVYRALIEIDSSFEELLAKTKQAHLESDRYDEVPFETIVDRINPRRSLNFHPIFQISINYDNTRMLGKSKRSNNFQPCFEASTTENKYDVSLYITELLDEAKTKIAFTWSFDANLFKADTIEFIAGEFEHLLSQLVQNTKKPVLSHPWRNPLSIAEERGQVDDVIAMFESRVKSDGRCLAVQDGVETITYDQLNERVNQFAWYLKEKEGVEAGDCIAVAMEREISRVIAVLAILKVGGVFVPLSKEYPLKRNLSMLSSVNVKLVILAKASLKWMSLERLYYKFIIYDGLETQRHLMLESAENIVMEEISNEALSHIIFTSGSTGSPKGFKGTRSSLSSRIAWMCEEYSLVATSCCHITSMVFIRGLWELLVPLCGGAKLFLSRREDLDSPAETFKFLSDNRVEQIVTAPSYLHSFCQYLKDENLELKDLKRWFVSGEQFPSDYALESAAVLTKTKLINLYGSTELMSDVLYGDVVVEGDDANRSLKHILPGNKATILDSYGGELPQGVVGELVIKGNSVGNGYLGQDYQSLNQTQFKFEGECSAYNTGDLAKFTKEGNIDIVGRKDNLAKIRGFRVDLQEIEFQIRTSKYVQFAAVIVEGADLIERNLSAYITLSDSSVGMCSNDISLSIRNYLKQTLPHYMIPSRISTVDRIPFKRNGKIDKLALSRIVPAQALSKMKSASSTEVSVLKVWQKVLRRNDIEPLDDFFEVGGNSLLALRLIDEIKVAINIKLSPSDLFEHSVLRELCKRIDVI